MLSYFQISHIPSFCFFNCSSTCDSTSSTILMILRYSSSLVSISCFRSCISALYRRTLLAFGFSSANLLRFLELLKSPPTKIVNETLEVKY